MMRQADYPIVVWIILSLVMAASPSMASDIPSVQPIGGPQAAQIVCPQSCEKHDCAWSGEWRTDKAAPQGAVCDCGIARTRAVPGGHFRTADEARVMCTETCGLNGDTWNGKVQSLAGSYDMCGCEYVSDWCEPKTN